MHKYRTKSIQTTLLFTYILTPDTRQTTHQTYTPYIHSRPRQTENTHSENVLT